MEELLRYDSPVQRTARVTKSEIQLGGKTIPRHALVVAAIGAANRDPGHFADPDRLDITRRDNDHIAFGFGIHFCLGANLARLEARVALEALLARTRDFERTTSEPLPLHPSPVFRAVTRLPLRLEPR